jgi:hypothetical protein
MHDPTAFRQRIVQRVHGDRHLGIARLVCERMLIPGTNARQAA